MSRRGERGASNVGCIVGLAILAVVVLLAVRIIPVRVAVAELQDFCEKAADSASLPRMTNEIIADEIRLKAEEQHLPVSREDIKVWRDSSEVHVEVKYTVILDLYVHDYRWDVVAKADRTLF
jgi:hypothetical protein